MLDNEFRAEIEKVREDERTRLAIITFTVDISVRAWAALFQAMPADIRIVAVDYDIRDDSSHLLLRCRRFKKVPMHELPPNVLPKWIVDENGNVRVDRIDGLPFE